MLPVPMKSSLQEMWSDVALRSGWSLRVMVLEDQQPVSTRPSLYSMLKKYLRSQPAGSNAGASPATAPPTPLHASVPPSTAESPCR